MPRPRLLPVLALAATLSLALLAATGSASAAGSQSFARKGVVHACVDAKGAHKGRLRVVRGLRCHRGERRFSWIVTPAPGSAGAAGGAGSPGQPGAKGDPGSPGDQGAEGKQGGEGKIGPVDQTLKTLIDAQKLTIEELSDRLDLAETTLDGRIDSAEDTLNDRIDAAEDTLGKRVDAAEDTLGKRIDSTETTLENVVKEMAKLAGITAGDLTTTINTALVTLPRVEELCTQTALVTGQANSLLTSLSGLGLTGVVPPLEIKLSGPKAPDALPVFACK